MRGPAMHSEVGWRTGRVAIAVAGAAVLSARPVAAACNIIPSATGSFRGALGGPLRPFAAPAESVELRVRPSVCDVASPGFAATAEDHVVTVVFTPPHGAPRNVVVLAADCAAVESQRALCATRPDVDTATCITVDPGGDPASLALVTRNGEQHLSFRFPDTDAVLAPAGDRRGFTGPATIAVTLAGTVLPCGLASAPCRSIGGTIACVDELYDVDGTCRVDPALLNATFGHFTALPTANDYGALCTPAGSVCTGLQDHVRFTVDAAGNLLLPVDWSNVLVPSSGPVPRILRASTSLPAFGSGSPIRLPSRAFLASYTPEGIVLPPIFEPQLNPTTAAELTLFGSADAPYTILRIARRGPERKVCAGGSNNGRPCATTDPDCPGGTCAAADCVGGSNAGATCSSDADCPGGECGAGLFDLGGLLQGGVGPIVLPRLSPIGVCDAGPQSGQVCPPATCPGSACVAFRARAGDPVPLDSLFETSNLFAFAASEPLAGRDINGDGDQSDTAVVTAVDRVSGDPFGQCSASATACERDGDCAGGETCVPVERGAVRVFPDCPDAITGSPPAVAAGGEVVAFLEPEGTSINADGNGDGDVADALVRVFNFGLAGNPEVTLGSGIAVDPSKPVNGTGIAASDGKVFYRRGEAAGVRHVTERVSVDTALVDPNAASGTVGRVGVSADGRYVVFTSLASNLVPGDTNGVADVFVYDRTLETTERVSVDDLENEADGPSGTAVISSDGAFVAFESDATNLVAGDTNGVVDVFVRNRVTGTTRRASVDTFGLQADGPSFAPAIGDDGAFVAFVSTATNLIASDTNGVADVFVRAETTFFGNATLRVSVSSGFVEADGASGLDGIAVRGSENTGVEVAYTTAASNLSPSVQGVPYFTAAWVNQSLVVNGSVSFVGWGPGREPTVGHGSSLPNYCGGFAIEAGFDHFDDNNGFADVYALSDSGVLLYGPLSRSSAGEPGNAPSRAPAAAAEAPLVAFSSSASNFAPDPSVGDDVFLHALSTGATVRVSGGATGLAGNAASDGAAISADGSLVAFRSDASDLVAGDGNGFSDVFAWAPDPTDVGADVTGNGSLGEVVLERLDPATGARTTICPADKVAVAAGTAVFLRPEAAGATPNLADCPVMPPLSLNGDGDFSDLVLHLARPTGVVENLGKVLSQSIYGMGISAMCVGGNNAGAGCDAQSECPGGACNAAWVAAEIFENGTDANGDGDGTDVVVMVHAVDDPPNAWESAGLAAGYSYPNSAVQVQGSVAAVPSNEGAQGGQDLNGDGDPNDIVLQLYDAATGTRTNVGRSASNFKLGAPEWIDCGSGAQLRQLLAFGVYEGSEGAADLNGDGDLLDIVLHVYDLSTKTLTNTGQQVGLCTVLGCTSALGFRINQHRVKFLTNEYGQGAGGGTDLNADGDRFDLVIQSYDACTRAVRVVGTAGSGDPLRDSDDDGAYHGSSGGRCQAGPVTLASPGSCQRDEDCPPGAVCVPASSITVGDADPDGDGIPAAIDNCPEVANAAQADADQDGVGDDCDLAVCGNGKIDPGETCDDGNHVAGDGCSAGCQTPPPCTFEPMPGCRAPSLPLASMLKIKLDDPTHARDSLSWVWKKGAATAKADFGAPAATTGYALCLYDETGDVPSLVRAFEAPAGGICAGAPCWKEKSAGYKYADKDRTPAGLRKLTLKAGGEGAAKIALKGKGAHLGLPALPLQMDSRVTVQLQSRAGQCWGARFSVASKNDPTRFAAKSD